jgi:peroxiredoxin
MLELIENNLAESTPDFSGLDTRGQSIKLSDYKGRSNVILVLSRGFG